MEDVEAQKILKESQDRIKSMALIHEKLYQSPSLNKIDFKDYLNKLVSDLFYSYQDTNANIELELNVQDLSLNIETAIPLGLIINEIITNSLKYAFPEEMKGIIKVSLKKFDSKYELKVCDNGIGFPKSLDYKKTDTIGLQLVNGLINQIDGEITLDMNQKTEFKITFNELK